MKHKSFFLFKTGSQTEFMTHNDVIIGLATSPAAIDVIIGLATSPAANDVIIGLALSLYGNSLDRIALIWQ
jgi:hypothetical protein